MNERASERASVSVNEAGPCSRRQAIPWFQRTQPMSIRPDDSFNKSLLNSGRFHFNQRRDLSSNGSVGKKKKKASLITKMQGGRRPLLQREEKLVFPRKFKNHWIGMSVNRIALLEVSCALKLSFSHSFTSRSNHECAILFSIYYECTVNAHSNLGSSPLILFVKGV